MKRIPEVDSQWENIIPLEFIFVRTILFCHSIKRKDYFVTNLMLPFQRQVVKMLMVVQYFIKKNALKSIQVHQGETNASMQWKLKRGRSSMPLRYS